MTKGGSRVYTQDDGASSCNHSWNSQPNYRLHHRKKYEPENVWAWFNRQDVSCSQRADQHGALRDCCLTRQFSQMQIHSVDCAISSGCFGMVEGLVCT